MTAKKLVMSAEISACYINASAASATFSRGPFAL